MRRFARRQDEDPMSTLCRMAAEIQYEDLPDETVNCAKQSILDTMAGTVGGSAMEGIPAVVSLVKEKGGKPESVIPFYGGRVPASEAAFAIGPMARAMDFGQVHEEAGHCGEYILPTLLAAAGLKDSVSGKEFITAFTVGQEVLSRTGTAYKCWNAVPIRTIGGHYIFGAVAAAGKLLGLSLDELENAEGIALEMTQPHTTAMYASASLIARVHHGFVCQDAINICLLAKRGITGPRQEVLIGDRGYLGFAAWKTDPPALTTALGEKWDMLRVHTKLYPSCRCTHSSIDGILELMDEYNFKVEDIAGIHIDVSPRNWSAVCVHKDVKWNPQTVPECQFSLPYIVATAAFNKALFLDAYTPESMARRDVRELMTMISAERDESLPAFGSRLHITLKDGRKISREYAYPKGDPINNPVSQQDMINKFKQCVPYSAFKLGDDAVEKMLRALLNLETVDNIVDALLLPLTPPSRATRAVRQRRPA